MHNAINRLSVLKYAAGLLFLATTMTAGAQQYEIRYQALGLKPLNQTDFVSHTFTTCGKTGRLGPSLGMCASAYNGAEILKPEYNYGVVDGIQQWTVPADGVYTFEIAAPSLHASLSSAKGSIITSKVSLIKGEIVHVVAGQRGVGAWPVTEGASVNSNDGLGGAGGSFIYTGSIGGDGLIGAAGGGNLDCEPTSINGCLVRENDGHHGDLRTNRYSSGPGTGWLSSSGFAHVNVQGGQRFVGGNTDSCSYASCSLQPGGFGGGGGSGNDNIGGSGGYTGGANASNNAYSNEGYAGASSPVGATRSDSVIFSGTNSGTGYVTVTYDAAPGS